MDIDPHAGVVRLVFGQGTRAVDRSDDDYTRLVALNAPTRRPESNFDEVSEYSQHRAFPLSAGYWLEAVKLERTERLLAGKFDLATCTTRTSGLTAARRRAWT